MNVILEDKHWSRFESAGYCVYSIGYAVTPQLDYLFGDKFCAAILDNINNLSQFLRDINGQYSIIIASTKEYIIASDISKLYSVFFNDTTISDNDNAFITDNAEISDIAEYWLKNFGATCAGETLLKGVKQSKGGVIIRIASNNITEESYTNFLKPKAEITGITKKELAETINFIFTQLKTSLFRKDGTERQVVLSLSGGYDSRVVAERLVNHIGCTKLLFFTIGLNAKEQQTAINIAKILGQRCIRIDIEKEFPVIEVSDEMLSAFRTVGKLTSLHYVADYFALKYLREKGHLEDDAIFMTGHIGDTLGGSAVRQWGIRKSDSPRIIAYKIILSEFVPKCFLNAAIRKQIRNELESSKHITPASCQLGMSWSVMNSSTHRIASECNNYTYFGYEVRSPLFSLPLLDIASRMSHTNFHSLYNETLEDIFFKPADLFIQKKEPSKQKLNIQLVKNVIKAFLPRFVCVKYKNQGLDLLQESYIIHFMVEALVKKGIMKNSDDYLCLNEIMDSWYLLDLKRRLNNANA